MNTCEDTQIEEIISSQEKTIELMLSLKHFLQEDITIQREILKHRLMEGKSFQTRASYSEDFNEEEITEISDEDIEDLLHDENLLETETQLLKDMLNQINDDFSALKLDKDLMPSEDADRLLEEGFLSSEESLIEGKQLYRDIVIGQVGDHKIKPKNFYLEASSQYHIRKEKASLKIKCDQKGKVLESVCNKRGEGEKNHIERVPEILDETAKLHDQVGRENYKLVALVEGMEKYSVNFITYLNLTRYDEV